MFGDGALTLTEFAMRDPLPLATIHDAILEFLLARDDAALFGAQAVNAYVDDPRMTQDVDILSTRAPEFAEELRAFLGERFAIATCVRVVAAGRGFRIYQLRQPKNRHLADVRSVAALPPTRIIGGVQVPIPEELVAQKVISLTVRSVQPKGDTDRRDVKVLLLAYPDLQRVEGPVRDRLVANGASDSALREWGLLAGSTIVQPDDDDEFGG
jgi:hypothetical protein